MVPWNSRFPAPQVAESQMAMCVIAAHAEVVTAGNVIAVALSVLPSVADAAVQFESDGFSVTRA